ncbi:MAG TPA: purine phosphorylase [Thermodesulfobacteriota bacterium]|nr:purine phosphorylase [Thermodesulfobacteriota bacterium]
MRRLGIVVAMTAEARSLVREPTVTKGLTHLAEGILVKLSGIGPRRAGEAAKNLLGHGATALLSWGCAGALVPTLSPGSLFLPSSVIGADQCSYSPDPTWHGCLLNRLKGCVDLHQGSLAESGTVLRSSAEKRVLFERTGAMAVDMESGAVARVAQEADAPFVAIRAIADSADMAIPQSSVGATDEFGELNLLRLLKELIRRPFELFAMIRLAWNFRAAQVTLAKVARLAGTNLLLPQ